MLRDLDRRIERMNMARPLPVETRRSLTSAPRTHMTYASNAIEGNQLTLAETQVVLEVGQSEENRCVTTWRP